MREHTQIDVLVHELGAAQAPQPQQGIDELAHPRRSEADPREVRLGLRGQLVPELVCARSARGLREVDT